MRSFGLGKLFATVSGSQPVEIGLLQGIKTDFSWDIKELYGQKSFPVEVARGKAKCTLSADFAEIRSEAFNRVLEGTITAGTQYAVSADNAHTIIAGATVASTAYTPTVPGSGTYVSNLQVVNVNDTSLPPVIMTAVGSAASVTATGQYFVSAGTYLFSTVDAGKNVQITYEYSLTTGSKLVVTNQFMGQATKFSVRCYNTYAGYQLGLYFPAVIAPKLSFDFKLDDFVIPSMDFQVMADGAGNVCTAYFGLG